MTDLYLPSDTELTLLTHSKEKDGAIAELLKIGIKAIVHKQGEKGAAYYSASESLTVDAFSVYEVDPTGAGDCFGATFTSLWLRGSPPAECLRFASAAGALAVTKRGPMEGTSDLASLEKFLGFQNS
jgi:sugar/nucleoside kinase (ribokinase family)